MRGTLRSVARNVVWAAIGLVVGAAGMGWHGRPSDAAIEVAIRARSAAHARAAITLHDVQRNWVHEIFGTSASEFLVTATIAPPDEPATERCFNVEAGVAGTAIAFGPFARWRCDHPF